jgi:hypothetical protein
MPTNSEGVYSPPTNTQLMLATNAAANLIRAYNGTPADAFAKVARKSGLDRTDSSAVYKAISDASASVTEANLMRGDRTFTPDDATIPRVPGQRQYSGQYQYTLLIKTTNSLTGSTKTGSANVYSSELLNTEQIQALSEEQQGFFNPPVTSPDVSGSQGRGLSISVSVLGVAKVA